MAIILDNLKESIIIINNKQIDFANDMFLCKFTEQIISSNSLDIDKDQIVGNSGKKLCAKIMELLTREKENE